MYTNTVDRQQYKLKVTHNTILFNDIILFDLFDDICLSETNSFVDVAELKLKKS